MKLTQDNFDMLVDGMNHRLTSLEGDVKWVKYFGYYLTTLITSLALLLIGGIL